MALKTWHRAGLVAAGMALAAIAALPPRPMPEPDSMLWVLFRPDVGWWEGRTRHSYTLGQTLNYLSERHRAAVMAESLLALAGGPHAVRSADGALTVLYERPLTADSARVWLGMLERELALAPKAAGGGMPIIVALRSVPGARPSHTSLPPIYLYQFDRWLAMRFVSPPGVRPACFAALRLFPQSGEYFSTGELIERDPRTHIARTTALDWCLLYARFGQPGAQVERWAGRRVEVRTYWAPGDNYSLALEAQRRGRAQDGVTPGLSPQELEAYWKDPLNATCLRGSRPVCLKSVGLVKDITLRSEASWIRRVRRSFLASLMLQDPVRFQRFWRSDQPPAVALEQAWGKPAGDLVAEWKRSVFVAMPSGPQASAGALLASLGWAAVAMAIGVLLAMRRQVGS